MAVRECGIPCAVENHTVEPQARRCRLAHRCRPVTSATSRLVSLLCGGGCHSISLRLGEAPPPSGGVRCRDDAHPRRRSGTQEPRFFCCFLAASWSTPPHSSAQKLGEEGMPVREGRSLIITIIIKRNETKENASMNLADKATRRDVRSPATVTSTLSRKLKERRIVEFTKRWGSSSSGVSALSLPPIPGTHLGFWWRQRRRRQGGAQTG